MVDSLRERIAEGLRERTAEDLSERLALLIKERFESAQRERLGGAVRDALAEQIALGGGFDPDHIAEAVRDRIADHLCDTVAYGVRERLGEILREPVSASLRSLRAACMRRPALRHGELSRTRFDSRRDVIANVTCAFHWAGPSDVRSWPMKAARDA